MTLPRIDWFNYNNARNSRLDTETDNYNSAAEILTGFLLPSGDDQRELEIKEKYGGEEWGERLQEHFAAAAQGVLDNIAKAS